MWTIAVGEFHPTVAGIVTHSFVLLEIVQQQQSLANRGERYFVQVTAKVLVNAVTGQVRSNSPEVRLWEVRPCVPRAVFLGPKQSPESEDRRASLTALQPFLTVSKGVG